MQDGTRTVPQFINAALYDKKFGYYTSGQVQFGTDFNTNALNLAPLLAERYLLIWKSMVFSGEIGLHEPFYVYEFGAGIGIMAEVTLLYIKGRAKFYAATEPEWAAFYNVVRYVIAEISPALLKKQQERLSYFSSQNKVEFYESDARKWDDGKLPKGAGVVVSNELIDAFPPHEITLRLNKQTGEIHAFASVIITKNGKHHKVEKPIEEVLTTQEQLFFNPILQSNRSLLIKTLQKHGSKIFYVQPDMENYFRKIKSFFKKGYVITIDYGRENYYFLTNPDNLLGLRTYSRQFRQSRKDHTAASFLEHVGKQDITCDVDFSQLEHCGSSLGFGLTYFGMENSIGGTMMPEVRLLIQDFGLSDACRNNSTVLKNMKIRSLVRYDEMVELAKWIEQLDALFNKEQSSKNPSYVNLFNCLASNQFSTKDESSLIHFYKTVAFHLITQIGIERNMQSAFTLMHLLENKKHARVLLTLCLFILWAVPSENTLEVLDTFREIVDFYILPLMYRKYPEYRNIVESERTILCDFNFMDSDKSVSLLTRCLQAGKLTTSTTKENIAVKKIALNPASIWIMKEMQNTLHETIEPYRASRC